MTQPKIILYPLICQPVQMYHVHKKNLKNQVPVYVQKQFTNWIKCWVCDGDVPIHMVSTSVVLETFGFCELP